MLAKYLISYLKLLISFFLQFAERKCIFFNEPHMHVHRRYKNIGIDVQSFVMLTSHTKNKCTFANPCLIILIYPGITTNLLLLLISYSFFD